MRASSWLLPAVCLWTAGPVVDAQESTGPTVEYIAHAAVIIESSSGTRVLIDPYNGDMWMGYDFPNGIEVDAILVTHPHHDHDASWYFDPSIPVFQRPGSYRVGDINLLGRLLADAGLNERAATHYRFVLGQKRTYAADVLAESRAFMEGR